MQRVHVVEQLSAAEFVHQSQIDSTEVGGILSLVCQGGNAIACLLDQLAQSKELVPRGRNLPSVLVKHALVVPDATDVVNDGQEILSAVELTLFQYTGEKGFAEGLVRLTVGWGLHERIERGDEAVLQIHPEIEVVDSPEDIRRVAGEKTWPCLIPGPGITPDIGADIWVGSLEFSG